MRTPVKTQIRPILAVALAMLAGAGSRRLEAADAALRVSGVAGSDGVLKPAVELTLAELGKMPRAKARVRGRDGKERTYEGVRLAEILKRAGQPLGEQLRGGAQLTRYIVASAHDGYRVLFSIPEIDPAFSDDCAFVADTVEGQALSGQEGPLRIIVPGEKREARWIRMVERIEVMSAPEPLR